MVGVIAYDCNLLQLFCNDKITKEIKMKQFNNMNEKDLTNDSSQPQSTIKIVRPKNKPLAMSRPTRHIRQIL